MPSLIQINAQPLPMRELPELALGLKEGKMSGDTVRPNCLAQAAHWRRRSEATNRAELRDAYQRLADSYEQLARQSSLCWLVVTSAAYRRGEEPICQCEHDPTVLDSHSLRGGATQPETARSTSPGQRAFAGDDVGPLGSATARWDAPD